MPNVTIYVRAGQMPVEESLAELTRDCIKLCTEVLEAELKNVHVVYVEVRHGHGLPVFAEVQYRLESARTPLAMNRFMESLELAIVQSTGLTARIRCFGYIASHIHARN